MSENIESDNNMKYESEFVKALKNSINPISDILTIPDNSKVPSKIRPLLFVKLRGEISKMFQQKIDELIKDYNLNEISATLDKLKKEQVDNELFWRPNRDVCETLKPYENESNIKKKKYLKKLIKAQEGVEELNKKRYDETLQEVKANFADIAKIKKDQIMMMTEQKNSVMEMTQSVLEASMRI